ncbi:MAG: bifunctional [glutamate--ammonia ligase]-adenylyl-L-tyrosine phosphorylase/[glutamate--ammonia-ligase] adenylyltransferase [Rhodospirillaceae bacterium]|nr:bifunctional [glutamate--ammonia ligase]-adenylyl-L-tyrosine phosphorylase/[glutamate--ammonia-ligase] adenylyltransferase [Rhodospirillaceae bacterium]
MCGNPNLFGTVDLTIFAEIWGTGTSRLPAVGNPDQEDIHRQRWREALGRCKDSDLAAYGEAVLGQTDGATHSKLCGGGALLSAIFGNSPFLSQCLISDLPFARRLLEAGPDVAFDEAREAVTNRVPLSTETTNQIKRRLRVAKRRAALAIAAADVANVWQLERVIGALSDFADAALKASCRHLLRALHNSGELSLAHPEDPESGSGLIILGMGKLGARELNYSSDIDLIILFDQDTVPHTGDGGLQHLFTRFARNLVALMDERTRDGYVFRTDLRLRPDPGATPPAMSVLAAEVYYESAGQNWERAAMIKARPVAGDEQAGLAFLDILRPFMWRRSLDFAAIQDIQSIKRQINAYRGGAQIAVGGHNIKLGRGGIREIEFYAQTQQLIWGGRDPDLRVRGTVEAIKRLAEANHVAPEVLEDLTKAYNFHRRVEHRLQMTDDRQTHELPNDAEGLLNFSVFLGYKTVEAFTEDLLSKLQTVAKHYAALFEDEGDLAGTGNLVFTGAEDDPDTLKNLAEMGFSEPAMISSTVRVWHAGRYRAMRSARARELLTELLPSLLESVAASPNPDLAFRRFDAFLQGLPAGVQLFSLFMANPGLFDFVVEIMAAAPKLAGWLSRYPILLDGVLSSDFFDFVPDAVAMGEELSDAGEQARDFQDFLDIERRWANDKVFQIGAHMLRGRLTPVAASGPLSDVADTCLKALLPEIERIFSEDHGKVPGGTMAVVAFGKLGSREMTVSSDLDLMFVYDCPSNVIESDGPKPLPPGQYYARLCQRFIGAITAPTVEGKLYDVDMRLRPAGDAGPIASSLEAFTGYQKSEAWTWEYQALTRARVVCAQGDLGARFDQTMHKILTTERDETKLLNDVVEMRGRLRKEYGTDDIWLPKHFAGGLIDIEFIAQYLQLRYAACHSDILAGDTVSVLEAAGAAGMTDKYRARDLVAAAILWRNLQGILRLTVDGNFHAATAAPALKTVIARACGSVDFDALMLTMEAAADCTKGHFETIFS